MTAPANQRAVIVAAAPTGAWKQRRDFPTLPVTADQIAEEAWHCMEAGASMLHLHVRAADGSHSLDPILYNQAVRAVSTACGDGLLLQLTTEAGGVYAPDEQAAAILDIEHDFLSIAMSELLAQGTTADLGRIGRVFEALHRRGTTIQVILYDAEQITAFESLISRNVIPVADYPMLFVLGRYTRDQSSSPQDLEPFLARRDPAGSFMVCAFGSREIDCMVAAADAGGDTRVGLENNALRGDGKPLTGSAASVASLVEALGERGYRIADANEARSRLLANSRRGSTMHRPR